MRLVALFLFPYLLCLIACGGEGSASDSSSNEREDWEEIVGDIEVRDPLIYFRQPEGLDFRLVDVDRNEVRLSDQKGKVAVVSFFFRSCPDAEMCPALLGKINRVVAGLSPEEAEQTEIFAISFDPQNDTPEALKLFAEARELKFRLLTGHPDSIREVARRNFGIGYTQEGPALFAHNMKTFVFDPTGELGRVFEGSGWSPDEVVQAITERIPDDQR